MLRKWDRWCRILRRQAALRKICRCLQDYLRERGGGLRWGALPYVQATATVGGVPTDGPRTTALGRWAESAVRQPSAPQPRRGRPFFQPRRGWCERACRRRETRDLLVRILLGALRLALELARRSRGPAAGAAAGSAATWFALREAQVRLLQ